MSSSTGRKLTERFPEYQGLGQFDFGLSAEEEEKAAQIHQEAIIIDLVFQHPGGYRLFEREPFKSKAAQLGKTVSGLKLLDVINFKLPYDLDLELMQELWDATGVTAGLLDAFMDMTNVDQPQIHLEVMARIPWLSLALTAEDIRRAKRTGAHAGIAFAQPVWGFGRDISLVEKAYARGLRSLLLTYNKTNVVGCGCTERLDHGLTDFGLEVVKKQNELGMIIDLSHCGKKTTLDACKFSQKPVTANHTNVERLFSHPRCKSDDEIKAIADTGGLVGISCVPFFLSEDVSQANINMVFDHIDYVADLVGWQHVGLGSDWPHTVPKDVLRDIFSPTTVQLLGGGGAPSESTYLLNVVGFDDYLDYPNITRGLVKRGYSTDQIKGVLGENYLRIFQEVCG
ncbi:MAG: membrane dipeptidase [Deltaproteobacteria bacterium]|nr:membrane dipeptidase [Deltaproteobacteria bacterium]